MRSPHNAGRLCLSLSLISAITLMAAGCGTSGNAALSSGGSSGSNTGEAFVIGTDTPVAAVTSFQVQIESINAIDANGNSTPLLAWVPVVDFARYNGLQTLLDMNNVPAGTYTSISVTFGKAILGFLQQNPNEAPTVNSMSATLSTSTVQQTLSTPLVVSQTGPVGIHLDFDLNKSIQVDGSGQITGVVNPTLDIKAIGPSAPEGFIDEFDAAVLSVDQSKQSFVIQGPHGLRYTVNVNSQTDWDGNENLSDLSTSSIVQVSGTIDRADSTIDANEVAILSQNGFYAGGQVTFVLPSTGPATTFEFFVRGFLPTTTGLLDGQIAKVDLTGDEKYFIYWMRNPLTEFLFNSSALLPGQSIAIGGPASGAANSFTVTCKRVVLRDWGFNGTIVPNSVKDDGSFQMNVTGFAGQLVSSPVTVYALGPVGFRYGLSGMSQLSTTTGQIRVVGLLLKNPTNGQSVLLAHYIDLMN